MKKILLASLLLAAGSAYGQDQQSAPADAPQSASAAESSGQATNNVVGVKLAPGVRGVADIGFETVYNSNFYLQDSNPQSAFGFLLSPSIGIVGDSGDYRYQMGAGLEAARFTNVEAGPNSYLDAIVKSKASWAPLTRHHFSADIQSKYGHDPFGSFRTENGLPLSEGLDRWIQNSGYLTYRYGADSAKLNLESAIGIDVRRYQTNRDATRYLDYRIMTARETAYYNVSSKTALLAEIIHSNQIFYSQTPGFPTHDAQENRIRVGMRWLATAHTYGDVRIGQYRHDSDSSQLRRIRAIDWAATLNWAPLVYSVITLQTGNQSQQTYLADVSYIENRFATLLWRHDWSSALETRASATYLDSEFIDSSRQDHIGLFSAEADYRASLRWMWIAGASYSKRTSNIAARGYNNTSVYLGVKYSH
jgi:hypothetical protein